MRALVVIALVAAAAPSSARVPSAAKVLERTDNWRKSLHKNDVTYSVGVYLAGPRSFESQQPPFDSEVFTLWSALVRGGGMQALRTARVDTGLCRLYHLNRRVVVVVGALPKGRAGWEVWFDRDTGAVARVVRASADGGREVLTLRGVYPPRVVWEKGKERMFTEPVPR